MFSKVIKRRFKRWLAFYQTAKFGGEKWVINHIAPVCGHELIIRA